MNNGTANRKISNIEYRIMKDGNGLRWLAAVVLAMSSAMLAAGCQKNDDSEENQGFQLQTFIGKAMPRPGKEVLKDAVTSTDADARRTSLEEMAKWKNPDDKLIELVGLTLLGDGEPLVRAQAALTLGAWKNPGGVVFLSKGLTGNMEKTPMTREGKPLVTPQQHVADTSKLVRTDCARALGEIPAEEAVKPLVDGLRFDPEADVRSAAAQALAAHRSVSAANGLVFGLSDGGVAVAESSRTSLGYLTGRDLGDDPAAWSKFLAESKDPLAGYGHTPKRSTTVKQIDTHAAQKEGVKQIFKDMFPLEKKEGPFE